MTEAPYLIIGASQGIGRALAVYLIEQGHPVITLSRSDAEMPGALHHVRLDATDPAADWSVLPDALAGMAYCPGSIDLKPLRSLKDEDLRRAFEVNVVGAFRAAQATVDRLRKVPGSSMLFFSTVAVGQGMAFHAAVAAAKGGVEGLARSLAAELAPTVRVNCIAPSLTRTSLAARLLGTPEKERGAAERHPLKRIGEPEDAAALGAFLLDPKAGWITGQVIGVDGGLGHLR